MRGSERQRGEKAARGSERQRGAAPDIPRKLRSARDLADLQRAMWTLISRPLTADNRMPPRWTDGRPTAAVAAQIAKPNERLTSFERLEIYSRMYWFRVLDSLYEDCPGLRAVLGDRRFIRLAEAYLVKYPSRSFTLRDLPDRMARFIVEEPEWTRPHTALCHDIARFEWARVEVFDTAARPLFTTDDLLDADPARLRLGLQPYLQLLELDYPLDDFFLAVKQREELSRGDASNTALGAAKNRRPARVRRPRPAKTFVAIHRLEGRTYYKRLEPEAFRVLTAIRAGKTLARALTGLAHGGATPPSRAPMRPRRGRRGSTGPDGENYPRAEWAAQVQKWFQNWMQLGWFCRRE